ncbi:hypothetical protein HUS23_04995 [Ectothiorhodospiraceae bacterium 2226]|nr:hypothetical protein HUS23_04995 [Ectothiorhodospiraceae bacterium 2226]
MTEFADFDDAEPWVIKNAAKERVDQPVAAEFADTELRPGPCNSTLTTCPTAYRRASRVITARTAPASMKFDDVADGAVRVWRATD